MRGRRWLIHVAVALVAMQALWTSAATIVLHAGFEPARFMCATLADAPVHSTDDRHTAHGEHVGAASSAHDQDRRSDGDGRGTAHNHNDCAACLASHSHATSIGCAPVIASPALATRRARLPASHPAVSVRRVGPPLGVRAPPASVQMIV